MIVRRGFEYQLRTDFSNENAKRTKQIIIINTFGELFNIYSIGTIVFSGGSLVPQGGQNPLEPAIWGKVVFYGPHMDNFLDATALLEVANAGVTVENSKILADKAIWFMNHPEELKVSGERAREAVLENEGASEKHARVIERLLN
jgi:3-deoxy-D-manno-octulosonic-acid transferase